MSDELDPVETPLTGLDAIAIEMHEFYTALMNAGFDDAQAMYLTGVQLHHYNS